MDCLEGARGAKLAHFVFRTWPVKEPKKCSCQSDGCSCYGPVPAEIPIPYKNQKVLGDSGAGKRQAEQPDEVLKQKFGRGFLQGFFGTGLSRQKIPLVGSRLHDVFFRGAVYFCPSRLRGLDLSEKVFAPGQLLLSAKCCLQGMLQENGHGFGPGDACTSF